MFQTRWWMLGPMIVAMLGPRAAEGGWLFGNRGGCGQAIEVRSPLCCMPICRTSCDMIVELNAVEPVATPAVSAIAKTSIRLTSLRAQVFEWNPSLTGGSRTSRSGGGVGFNPAPASTQDPEPSASFGGLGGGSFGSGGASSEATGPSAAASTSSELTSSLHFSEPWDRSLMDLTRGDSGFELGSIGPSAVEQAGPSTFIPGPATGQVDHGGPTPAGPVSSVPEPSAIVSTLVGLAMAAGAWRSRRGKRDQSTPREDVA